MLHKVPVIAFCFLGLLLIVTIAYGQSAQQIYRAFEVDNDVFDKPTWHRITAARRKAMAARGYVWGENILFSMNFVRHGLELSEIVAQIKQTDVDLVWAWDQTVALAIKQGAPSVPVVALFENDPIQMGLVKSLAYPGGNVTGISQLVPELSTKRLQLLTELIPGASNICVLHNPNEPGQPQWRATVAAAQGLGVTLQSLEVDNLKKLRPALKQMGRSQCAGLLLLDHSTFQRDIGVIVLSASQNGLPVMCGKPQSAEFKLLGLRSGDTCIAAYGPSYRYLIERMADQADKILKGIPPAEIPVERPTRFELVINLATAKMLGIEIPPSILIEADKVVQ